VHAVRGGANSISKLTNQIFLERRHLMRYFTLILVSMFVSLISCPIFAGDCEMDRMVEGKLWTFQKLDDGNSMHELLIKDKFHENTALVLNLPCGLRNVDAIQVDWSSGGDRMKGELIINPGRTKLGAHDIENGKSSSWTVQRATNEIELRFDGPPNKDIEIKWIRVYYGVNASSSLQPSSMHESKPKNDEIDTNDLTGVRLIDRIRLGKATEDRNCRLMFWDGEHFHLVWIDPDGQIVRRVVRPFAIQHIIFGDRWGTAKSPSGMTFPINVKRFENGKLDFDKREGEQVITKTDYPLDKLSNIDFNK
jgi:hypothetical protein